MISNACLECRCAADERAKHASKSSYNIRFNFLCMRQVLGLYGMGGIGKTTLAKVLYNHLHLDFGSRCIFLSVGHDSREETIRGLQATMHEQLCGKEVRFCSLDVGVERLSSAIPVGGKVLIVLDNLWTHQQHDALLPDGMKLPSGSIVIMTSRDKSLLTYADQREGEWAVGGLPKEAATELICLRAFKEPAAREGFEGHVSAVVEACHGVPIMLNVTGGYLRERWQKLKPWESWEQIWKARRALALHTSALPPRLNHYALPCALYLFLLSYAKASQSKS